MVLWVWACALWWFSCLCRRVASGFNGCRFLQSEGHGDLRPERCDNPTQNTGILLLRLAQGQNDGRFRYSCSPERALLEPQILRLSLSMPVPCSLFPVPCSLFPVPCSLFPVPCSLKI